MTIEEIQKRHVAITAEMSVQKIPQILAHISGLSQQKLKAAMQKGAVWLETANGVRRIRRANAAIAEGDKLHLYYSPQILALQPPVPTLIADEQDYSVWNKPSGLLCQGSKWSDHCTINRWIEIQQPFELKPQRNCFIVHRLDKAARGLVLIAHTKRAVQKLTALFEQRAIAKCYRAIVEGEFPCGQQIIQWPVEGKAAHSVAERLDFDANKQQSLLSVSIETGRKHQIRRHLSQKGYPIVGDRLYGTAAENAPDLKLQSYTLQFTCPITQQIRCYTCPEILN